MITKTIWVGENDATKAYDEWGYPINSRLVGCIMSLNEDPITVTKENECDGFTIYSVTAPSSVWDEWETFLNKESYL